MNRQDERDRMMEWAEANPDLCSVPWAAWEEAIKGKNEQIDALKARLEPFESWPNIDALRQCMIDACAEIDDLKAEIRRLQANQN